MQSQLKWCETSKPYLGDTSTLPNYFLKISVIMTLSFGPPPPLLLASCMPKVADSHTWT